MKPLVDLVVYKPSSEARMKYLMIAGGFLGILICPGGFFLLTSNRDLPPGALPFLITFLFLIVDLAAYIYWEQSRARLIISPIGLEYIGSGYSLRTTWDSLLPRDANGKMSYDKGVAVKRALFDPTRSYRVYMESEPFVVLLLALAGRTTSRVDVDEISRGIPLDTFDPTWRSGQSSIGLLIRRYAPQVFGQPPTETPRPKPGTFPPSLYPIIRSSPRRSVLIALGILLLQIGLVLILVQL